MKFSENNQLKPLNKVQLKDLVKEVKETLAVRLGDSQFKAFNTVDLWNIHRQKKTWIYRRPQF